MDVFDSWVSLTHAPPFLKKNLNHFLEYSVAFLENGVHDPSIRTLFSNITAVSRALKPPHSLEKMFIITYLINSFQNLTMSLWSESTKQVSQRKTLIHALAKMVLIQMFIDPNMCAEQSSQLNSFFVLLILLLPQFDKKRFEILSSGKNPAQIRWVLSQSHKLCKRDLLLMISLY